MVDYLGAYKPASRSPHQPEDIVAPVDRFRHLATSQQQLQDSPGCMSWGGEFQHWPTSRCQQPMLHGSEGGDGLSLGNTASSEPFQSCYTTPINAGHRFFCVGQLPSLSDSTTESAGSANTFLRTLHSQSSVNQGAYSKPSWQPCFAEEQQHGSQHQAAVACLGSASQRTLSNCAAPQLWPQSAYAASDMSFLHSLGTDTNKSYASAATPPFQAFPRHDAETNLSEVSLADDIWSADCPAEDMEKLLTWASDPTLTEPTLSDHHSYNSSQSSMLLFQSQASPGTAPEGLSLARQMSDGNLSNSITSCGTSQTGSYSSPQHHQPHFQSPHSCGPVEAAPCLYTQQQRLQEEANYGADLSNASCLEPDPLDMLLDDHEAASMDPAWSSMQFDTRETSAMLHNPDGSHADSLPRPDSQAQQKKRCGRPRVYDLDTPIPADAASGKPQKAGGRGAKPKYIYDTAQEAIAKRRKRNRDTAIQSYYKRKEQVAILNKQMDDLKAENIALQNIMSLVEQGTPAKGWIREQLLQERSPLSVLQELHQSLALCM